jgi:alcohol dehydrogenase
MSGFGPASAAGSVVGGGSVLDAAKAMRLFHESPEVTLAELTLPFLDARKRVAHFPGIDHAMRLVAVPTTAGTGSEVTPVAVISDPDRMLKVGISSPHLIPVAAICDPELTVTCPPSLTAIAGADALTHAIEAFTAARRGANPSLPQQHVFIGKSALTDHFALLAIRLLGRSLEQACRNGTDEGARADVMMGALAAGCAFGTAGTAAAHAVQYPVGALTHTPHGLGVATMLPYVMSYNRVAAAAEIAEIGTALGLPDGHRTVDEKARATIDEIARLFRAIGIAPTLAELGLPADKLDWTADQALGIERLIKNNPRPFDRAAMLRLVKAAYDGDIAAISN